MPQHSKLLPTQWHVHCIFLYDATIAYNQDRNPTCLWCKQTRIRKLSAYYSRWRVITWSWMTSSGSIHTRVWQLISWLMDWTEVVNYISACSTGVKRSRLTPCHVAMLVCFNKCLLLSVSSVLSVKWFVLCTANVMTFIGIPQSAFIDN